MLIKILASLFLLSIFWICLPSFFLLKTAVYIQEGDAYTEEIQPGKSRQIIFSQMADQNISQVQLLLKNKALQHNESLEVSITSGGKIENFYINGSNIGDPSWLNLKLNNFNVQNGQLTIEVANPSGNHFPIFWYGQSFDHLSLHLYSKPTQFQKFLNSGLNLKKWIESTNHTYLVFYIAVLLFLCLI